MKKLQTIMLTMLLVLVVAGCGQATEVTNGSWIGNVFMNPSTNMKITIPENYAVYTAENIDQYAGGEVVSEYIDTMIWDPANRNNIAVALVPVDVPFTEICIMAVKEELEQKGLKVSDIQKTELCGEQYSYFEVDINNGIQQYYYGRVVGDKMVNVIITFAEGADVQDFLDMFEAIK